MKREINLRLIGIAMLAVFITLFCTTGIFYRIFCRQVESDLATSAQLLRETRIFDSEIPAAVQTEGLFDDCAALRITWIEASGTVLYDNGADAASLSSHADRPEILDAFAKGEGRAVRRSDTMQQNTFYYALLLGNGTVLRVSTEAHSLFAVFFSSFPTILLIAAAITAICIALSHFLTRQLVGPIEQMAKNLSDSSMHTPYKELVPFADMIRRQHMDILSAARMRQDFTANVSHELKTPLTAICGYAELIENDMADKKKQRHFASEIQRNARRLLSLINDSIRLSELDAGKADVFERLDLFKAATEAMPTLKVCADSRNVNLVLTGESCMVRASREMLSELVNNLTENAIRYNNPGGHVRVEVHGGDMPRLIVWDDGIGIPAADRERVFERFYRVDKSRSKATGGTGLGLAIVKHIAELLGASIELDSEPGRGTEITVFF